MGATCCNSDNLDDRKDWVKSPTTRSNRDSHFSFSREEIEADKKRRDKVDEIWKEYDTNNSGVLEKEQAYEFLRKSLTEMAGKEPTQEEVKRNFETIDADANGVLDKEEVQRFLKGFEMGASLKMLLDFD